MKRLVLLILLTVAFATAHANHIAGGELFYTYVGPGSTPGSSLYNLTMRLFRDCNSTGQQLETEVVKVGIYHSGTRTLVKSVTLNLETPIPSIQLNTSAIPCLVNAPEVCFQVGIFTGSVELPSTADGYILSWLRCCRANDISNLSQSTGVGGTFVTNIPGTTLLPTGHNSSPQFLVKDTALVCRNSNFVLNFGASDDDGDSLSYAFCSAYDGGTTTTPNPPPATTLILNPLPYQSPYSGTSPLGSQVSINPITGIISGVAPNSGRYVINVCVSEWRNGIVINVHHKDFILEIGDCNLTASQPVPHLSTAVNQSQYAFVACSSNTVSFSNAGGSASAVQSYAWDFGVSSITTDTSSKPAPTYTYADTGVYTITLVVRGSAGCIDTGRTTIGVYPGFTGNFNVSGSCYKNPFIFTDQTAISYGYITNWNWNFGDLSTASDVSSQQSPSYTYPDPGTRTAQLIVVSSKGCSDTATKPVVVLSTPLLTLPFHDTLICSIDSLPLIALGTGAFSWTPSYNIINPTSSTPIVYPKDTTTYVVSLTESGCVGFDSIKVNVIDTVSLHALHDTTICFADDIHLTTVSDGLHYQWTPVNLFVTSPNIQSPVAVPNTLGVTTFHVLATVGKCLARDSLQVKAVPYPVADAGVGDSICFGKSAQLHATMVGSSFTWQPTASLTNASTLNPVASPVTTTQYILTVYDTIGCPKPGTDVVTIHVTPAVLAYAGNDTVVVANQPLQLHASGGTTYQWFPAFGMNNPFVDTPIVTLPASVDSIIYRVRVTVPPGCSADDDIKVVVFKSGPDLFIPTGFTPNSDGRNDVLRPIAVGIKRLVYFRVYNRWGNMIYSTSSLGEGWDGTVNGVQQGTGTFIFMASAIDYLDRPIIKKGTIVLIR